MHDELPYAREPTEVNPCCCRLARELVGKTILVEQYLLPLLQHHEFPGGFLRDFKRRWREACLAGKSTHALHTIACRNGIPITPEVTDDELRAAILRIELD